jgi:two-component system cell cycle sensor histidine kinase/response regulator CckA
MPEAVATILNVEDDTHARRALSTILRAAGFRVTEAATGQEVLQRLPREPADLVLLDIQLPDLDGRDVLRHIKAQSQANSPLVVLVSGVYLDISDRIQGLDGGADGYVTKPVAPLELVAQMRALLRLRRAEEQVRQARAEADEAHARLAAIVESSDDAIIAMSLAGLITAWNSGAERLYGYRAAEVLGKPVCIIVPPDRAAELAALLEQIHRGAPVLPMETVRLRKGGQAVDVNLALSAIRDGRGHVSGASSIDRDITERKRLEEQYRQSQKMEAVGRLAGGIAHDFNNLLTVINGYTELLGSALGKDDNRDTYLAAIRRAGESAATLTRQLLAFSRHQPAAPRPLDLNAVVRHVERMLSRVLSEDIRLMTALEPTLGHTHADPAQIEQVLLNLAVNARDAMPRGGTLTIATRNVDPAELPGPARTSDKQFVLLTVSDTGCGMDRVTREHAFEPFFTTKPQGHGTGLGLATVWGIVSKLGGHIALDSAPGKGTTVRLYLPRSVAAPEAPAAAPDRTLPRGSETVLLVEDDPAVRALAAQVLRRAGYEVLEAGDAKAALRFSQARAGAIHLLVSDVVMPGLSGAALAEQVRQTNPRIRLLFVSGHSADTCRDKGLPAGVPVMQKPFATAELAHRVRQVLDAEGHL